MNVIVIGAGAAGMLAACHAAQRGHSVDVYEKNNMVGKKIRITGKGRCNITIHEGRNRQVRKMCQAARHPVASLRRVAEGELCLGDLKKGCWRYLTDKEVRYLKEL